MNDEQNSQQFAPLFMATANTGYMGAPVSTSGANPTLATVLGTTATVAPNGFLYVGSGQAYVVAPNTIELVPQGAGTLIALLHSNLQIVLPTDGTLTQGMNAVYISFATLQNGLPFLTATSAGNVLVPGAVVLGSSTNGEVAAYNSGTDTYTSVAGNVAIINLG